MKLREQPLWQPYKKRSILRVWLFGFAAGMSLLLSGNTLNFWLSTLKLDPIMIGAFSLVALPYACKFAWAPIIDNVALPFLTPLLGRRRSWVFLSHLGLVISLILLGKTNPASQLWLTSFFSFAVAFFAMSQDVALDAYRIDSLQEDDHGPGASMYSMGYRFGMLWSGAGAIYLSAYFTWEAVYAVMAFSVACLSAFILSVSNETTYREPSSERAPSPSHSTMRDLLTHIFITPFASIGNLREWLLILSFLIIYKLPDHFITVMANPFLLYIGYNEIEIATAHKLFGTAANILGAFLAGFFMPRLSLIRCLAWFGAIHILAHFFFILQYWLGYHLPMLYLLVAAEHITGGMAMAAYIGYISSLCQGHYSGTQYALLSSMMGISRVILPALSGLCVVSMGWESYFILCILLSLPGILLASKL